MDDIFKLELMTCGHTMEYDFDIIPDPDVYIELQNTGSIYSINVDTQSGGLQLGNFEITIEAKNMDT